jgi:predicted ATPase
VLALEDIHLADPDSVALTSLIIRHLSGVSMLVLVTVKGNTQFASPIERLVEERTLEGLGAVLDLKAFDMSEIRALILSNVGAEPEDRVIETVFSLAEGNPLLSVFTVRSLLESGVLAIDDGVCVQTRSVTGVPMSGQERFSSVTSSEAAMRSIESPKSSRPSESSPWIDFIWSND